MLEGDTFAELARVGAEGGSALQGSCVRCMSRVWDQCLNNIGQMLRRHKAIALLVAVGAFIKNEVWRTLAVEPSART